MADSEKSTNTNGRERAAASDAGRIPPQAIEVEMAVLGAMMLRGESVSEVIQLLENQKDVFYKEAHRKIFSAMLAIYQRNEPIDHISVAEELRRRGLLEEIGSAFYLTELSKQVTAPAHIETYCRIILEKSLARHLIETSTNIINDCYAEGRDAFELIDDAERKILSITESHIKRSSITLNEAVKSVFELIDKIQDEHEGITGVPTGFTELDRLTGGLQPSDLIILAARPSVGKTALALNMARNAAIEGRKGVAIFSLEMSVTQLVLRMLCSEARVDMHLVRTGKLPEDQWSRLTSHIGKLGAAKIFIDDTPSLSILELRAKARRLKEQHKIDFVIIDYLQLMQANRSMESREREISTISRSLKALAKELDIPILALSQLNRAVEQRTNKLPQLSDLRESGSLEQDSDVVLFIHREREEDPTIPQEDSRLATIIIGKQRNGPTSNVPVTFIKEYVRFENMERHRVLEPFQPTAIDTMAPF